MVGDDGCYRILLERKVDSFTYQSQPAQKVTHTYLDGEEVTDIVSDGRKIASSTSRPEALPVRTNDIADFGRLQAAAVALIQAMGQFSEENPASPEQLERLLTSYQNLIQWQIDIKRKVDQSNASIDLVAGRIRQLMS